MSSNHEVQVGIDIGTTKVVTCIGAVNQVGDIDIIGIGKSLNQGIRKGVIVDVEETVSAISSSLEEAEKMSGFHIDSAVVGISGPYIESEQSRGVIAIGRQDGEITIEDTDRAIEAAKAIPSKPNRENLHIIPISYIIDGIDITKDPVGMTGTRLEVLTNIVSCSSNAIKSLNRTLSQAGITPSDMIFSAISTAAALMTKRQMEIGSVLVDIGAATTSYAVFENGEVITCGVVPIGSMHITNDIAIGLRTNIDLAETIKIKYGCAMSSKVDESEEIDLSRLDKSETESIKTKYVSEIIEARLNELFIMIRDKLSEIETENNLPAGVVLTGGGAKLANLVDLAKETLRLPASIGKPVKEMTGLIDKCEDPVYSTAIGLMLLNKNKQKSANTFNFKVGEINGVVDKIRSIFKNFLP
ncbi:MAG: cell division protein FtsA [Candidatus Berkelbacteria bacterium]